MDIVLYTFTKRRNSTARPSGGTTYSGQLRESCSTSNPSIGFDLGRNSSPAQLNYAQIPAFDDRYYWIESWTWDAGLWWANMRVDVLASWKVTIGSSTNYVLRAAAASNGRIVDQMYPAIAGIQSYRTEFSTAWVDSVSPNTGYFVIGVVNSAGYQNAIGATAYYALNQRQFRDFMRVMLDTTSWTGASFDPNTGLSVDGLSEATYKSLFNPFQYVVSCIWVPIAPPAGEAISSIPLGWWSIPASAYPLTAVRQSYQYEISVIRHPQASRGSYLNTPPFTKMSLNLAPFGSYPLDPSMYGLGQCTLIVSIDFVQGKAIIRTFGDDREGRGGLDLYTTEMIGVPIQIAQVSQDILGTVTGAASGILGSIGAAITGNVGGAVMAAGNGISSAVHSIMPQVRTSGANGSWAGYGFTNWIQFDFLEVVEDDNTDLGRPLCERRQLSTLPGYQLIASPDIPARATGEELDEIINYLSTGYFYE